MKSLLGDTFRIDNHGTSPSGASDRREESPPLNGGPDADLPTAIARPKSMARSFRYIVQIKRLPGADSPARSLGILADPKSESTRGDTSIAVVTNVATMMVQQQKGKPRQTTDPCHWPRLEALYLAGLISAFRPQF